MKDQKIEKIDKNLIKEFGENLIKEHKFIKFRISGLEIDESIMGRNQAIHSSIITCKKLAEITAKKFYYEVIGYLKNLNE